MIEHRASFYCTLCTTDHIYVGWHWEVGDNLQSNLCSLEISGEQLFTGQMPFVTPNQYQSKHWRQKNSTRVMNKCESNTKENVQQSNKQNVVVFEEIWNQFACNMDLGSGSSSPWYILTYAWTQTKSLPYGQPYRLKCWRANLYKEKYSVRGKLYNSLFSFCRR